MNKLYVYAGTYHEATIWAWSNRYHTSQIHFIDRVDRVRGLGRGTIINLAGTYLNRDDWLAFKLEATLRGFKLIEEVVEDESNYTPSRPIRNISRPVCSEQD